MLVYVCFPPRHFGSEALGNSGRSQKDGSATRVLGGLVRRGLATALGTVRCFSLCWSEQLVFTWGFRGCEVKL